MVATSLVMNSAMALAHAPRDVRDHLGWKQSDMTGGVHEDVPVAFAAQPGRHRAGYVEELGSTSGRALELNSLC